MSIGMSKWSSVYSRSSNQAISSFQQSVQSQRRRIVRLSHGTAIDTRPTPIIARLQIPHARLAPFATAARSACARQRFIADRFCPPLPTRRQGGVVLRLRLRRLAVIRPSD